MLGGEFDSAKERNFALIVILPTSHESSEVFADVKRGEVSMEIRVATMFLEEDSGRNDTMNESHHENKLACYGGRRTGFRT